MADRSSSGRPLVSVLVPAYGMGRYLPATLDSILAQDHRPLEVVVVDGGSADETVSVLRDYGDRHRELRWISEPDRGPADAVNKGLQMAKGEIAAIQSADDVYYPGAVSAAVRAFDAHPQAVIVYGDAEVIDESGRYLSGPTRYLPFSLERYLAGSTFFPQSSTFFRPEVARQLGGWRSDYFVSDIDLWLRILFEARRRGVEPAAVKVESVLSAYRRHEGQRDKETMQIYESWRAMIAESPDIAALPWQARRAARAGALLVAQSYNPTGGPRYAAWQMWRALSVYPPSIRAIKRPRQLVPSLPSAAGARRRLANLRPGSGSPTGASAP